MLLLNGDTVLVDTGTYVENINFNGKNIVVGSKFLTTDDISYIFHTLIDGDSNGSVVAFVDGEELVATLIGFTITKGWGIGWDWEYTYGGGIYCINSTVNLNHLIIRGNLAGQGGRIYIGYNSDAIIQEVTLINNKAYGHLGGTGGGIFFDENSKAKLINVTVLRNEGDGEGEIYSYAANVRLENVLIAGNTASAGGGIVSNYSNPRLVNVTISRNTAEYGGGILCLYGARPIMVNTILWDNSPQEILFLKQGSYNSIIIAYSNVQGGKENIITNDNGYIYWFDSNIDADPLFVSPENNDYYLTNFSPSIDAGTAIFIWLGNTIVDLPDSAYQGNAPDMGAFESPYTAGINAGEMITKKFALYQNYPNPFNILTTIRFDLPKNGNVGLGIYDILGKEVEQLVSGWQEAGRYQVIWDATNISSGVYFITMNSGDFKQVKKAIVLK